MLLTGRRVSLLIFGTMCAVSARWELGSLHMMAPVYFWSRNKSANSQLNHFDRKPASLPMFTGITSEGCIERFLRRTNPTVYASDGTKMVVSAHEAVQKYRGPTRKKFGFDAFLVTHWKGLNCGEPCHKKQAGRKASLLARLYELGVISFWIEDFDAEDLKCEEINCFYPSVSREQSKCHNRVMGIGELSLAIKHAAAYYFMLMNGLQSAVVVEDDVILSDDFMRIKSYMSQAPDGWGVLDSGGPCNPLASQKPGFKPLSDAEENLLFHTVLPDSVHVMRCSHGYAISHAGVIHYFTTVIGGQCIDACKDGPVLRTGTFDRADDILTYMDKSQFAMYYMEPSPMSQKLDSERSHMIHEIYYNACNATPDPLKSNSAPLSCVNPISLSRMPTPSDMADMNHD